MKVVEKNVSVVNELRDFFVKELSVEPSDYDVMKEYKDESGNVFRTYASVVDDSIEIVLNIWNDRNGVDLGTRLYSIPLFGDEQKLKIRFPFELGLVIIELLNDYGVGFEKFGNGYSSYWIENDESTQRTKLWISDDFKYISLTRKNIQQQNTITISKEQILDKLGL